jgi:serine/threonine-protein kinase
MDRDTFFRHLRRSRLLSDREVEQASRLTDSDRPRAIARALVKQGVLTRFQAGRLLAGRPARLHLGQYRLLDHLGRGATGRVFKAVHSTMERVVAIKVILPGLLRDPAAVELFDREVRAAAQLHHPHIVTAYDANEIKGVRFLVMEYVAGPSLQGFVKGRGPLPVELACELLRQAALALQYAHERGMVHRDIKPANIILAHADGFPGAEGSGAAGTVGQWRGPAVKVVDFGLVRVRGAGKGGVVETIQAEPGAVFGTVDYISPEQAHDVHSVDIRSDLYSLGCTFYYALTGQVPFPGGSVLEKLLRQLKQEPRPLGSLRPEVPPAVAAIINCLMAKDPKGRFQTPGELAGGLLAVSGMDRRQWVPTQVAIDVAPGPPAEPEGPAGGPNQVQETSFPLPPSAVFEPPAAQPPGEGVVGPGGEAVPPEEFRPPVDLAFREKFRQWTALVEFTLRRRGACPRINREAFATLQRDLVGGCRALAGAADDERRAFFERLEELLKPWLNPQTLARTDLEIHHQLVEEFQQAERALDRWMAKAEDDQSTLGRLLTLFKRRQKQHDLREQLRQTFGVKW